MLHPYCDLAIEESGLSLLGGGWTGESLTPLWLGGNLQTAQPPGASIFTHPPERTACRGTDLGRCIAAALCATVWRGGAEGEDGRVCGGPFWGGTAAPLWWAVAGHSLGAGTGPTPAFPLCSLQLSSPYQPSQPGLDLLLKIPKRSLEALAEQGIEQRIDVRVEQHQPIGEGDGRRRDRAGGP